MAKQGFLTKADLDEFDGTLVSKLWSKDYMGLEKDIEKIIAKKVEDKMDAARAEWKRTCGRRNAEDDED